MPAPRLAFDTNLLFYGVNQDSPSHTDASQFLAGLHDDQTVALSELVLIELYVLLRNPIVNETPLGAEAAAAVIETWRQHPHWSLISLPAGQRRHHDRLWRHAAATDFAYRRVYDARLGFSLVHQGVTEFATVNVRDFQGLGFERVWNPLG